MTDKEYQQTAGARQTWGYRVAANLWTDPTTSHCVVELEVAELAAQKFDHLFDLLEEAWGVIANVGVHGDSWKGQHPDWVAAAKKFRDGYNAIPEKFGLMGKTVTGPERSPQ